MWSTSTRRTRRRRDDNCYIKRYHFLEGLSTYWRGQQIMPGHADQKKLAKRYTPFSYARTVTGALRRTLAQFRDSVIVLSYSSNAVPDAATIYALMREVKNDVQMRPVEHTYSFGTHAAARRRAAPEYLFIGAVQPSAQRPLTAPVLFESVEQARQRSQCPLPGGTKPICWPGLARSRSSRSFRAHIRRTRERIRRRMGGYRRFCVECGSELKQGARFCANCGPRRGERSAACRDR